MDDDLDHAALCRALFGAVPLGDDPTIAFVQKPVTPSLLSQEVRDLLDL